MPNLHCIQNTPTPHPLHITVSTIHNNFNLASIQV